MDQSHGQTRKTTNRTGQEFRRDSYEDDLYDDEWPARLPYSARRYNSDVRSDLGRTTADVQAMTTRGERLPYQMRRTNVPARRTADVPTATPRRRAAERAIETDEIITRRGGDYRTRTRRGQTGFRPHWLVFVGLAMFIMVISGFLFSMLVNWWTVVQDDLQYGTPRTYQTNAVVGHNDSASNPSHFIALNLNRHIEIIEFPGGDATKAKVYIGPVLIGQGQDLAPVTLTFKDVNGDGKPDMIINVQGTHFVFINDSGQFRPLRPGEKIQL